MDRYLYKKRAVVISFVVMCIVSSISIAQTFPVTTIVNNGNDGNRINLSYLPDGFKSSELNNFINEVTDFNNQLFSQPPFSNYINFFNAYAVRVPSSDSGADHPGTATDESEPAIPVSSVNTYFESTFDYFNIHRLLYPTANSKLFNVLTMNTPQYDQSIVIVNHPEYGGSGGTHATTSINSNGAEIAIHEIGHSFAGLNDEYYAGDFYAAENYNMTQETDPTMVRWEEWYGEQGVAIYQHCCGGQSSTWYRPHQNCKMRSLGSPFCAVCTQRMIDVIYSLISPIDAYTPSQNMIPFNGTSQSFSLDLILPQPNTLNVEWLLNGSLYASNVDNIILNSNDLNNGNNMLKAVVIDETSLSRTYLPGDGYEFSVTWTITNGNCPPTINLTGTINDGTYLAGNLIQSTGNINAGGQVIFESPIILLNPGFHAEFNSQFLARDGGCGY